MFQGRQRDTRPNIAPPRDTRWRAKPQRPPHSHDFRLGPVVQKHSPGGNGKHERAHHAGHVVPQPASITGHEHEVLGRTYPRGTIGRRLPASLIPSPLPSDDASRQQAVPVCRVRFPEAILAWERVIQRCTGGVKGATAGSMDIV